MTHEQVKELQDEIDRLKAHIALSPSSFAEKGAQESFREAIRSELIRRGLQSASPDLYVLRPAGEYHEDMGTVIWWILPVHEPPIVDGYEVPDDYTHFSPLPDCRLMTATDGAKVGQ